MCVCYVSREERGKGGRERERRTRVGRRKNGGAEMGRGKKKICNLARKPQDYVLTISIGKIS